MSVEKVRPEVSDKVDDRYRIRLWNPSGGRYKKVIHGKRAAGLHEAEMKIKLARGGVSSTTGRQITVSQLMEKIFDSKKLLAENSITAYRQSFATHLEPVIGDRKVTSLARESLLLTGLLDGIERSAGRGMRIRCESILRGLLRTAMREGVLDRNPLDGIPFPKKVPVRGVPYAPELVDVLRVRDEVIATPGSVPLGGVEMTVAALDVLIGTGVRVGELMGISEDDIDWERKTITINRQIIYLRPEAEPHAEVGSTKMPATYIFSPPKTDDSGYRTIPVPQFVLAALAATKMRNGTRAISLPWERRNGAVQTHNLFFYRLLHGRQDMPANPNHLTTRMSRIGKRLGLDGDLHGHGYRHRYTTILHDAGVPQVVVDYVTGHLSRGSVTMTVYTHTTKEGLDRARRAIDDAWTAALVAGTADVDDGSGDALAG